MLLTSTQSQWEHCVTQSMTYNAYNSLMPLQLGSLLDIGAGDGNVTARFGSFFEVGWVLVCLC